jgi:hypothetical protein
VAALPGRRVCELRNDDMTDAEIKLANRIAYLLAHFGSTDGTLDSIEDPDRRERCAAKIQEARDRANERQTRQREDAAASAVNPRNVWARFNKTSG